MRLILSLTGGGLSGPTTMRTLSEGSVTIGRGASNGWVLPDSQQLMSRTHCAVSIEGNRVVLTDLSSNGVFVNGAREPTERDMRIVLTDGDTFAFGEYSFKVVIIDDGAEVRGGGSLPAASFPIAPDLGVGARDSLSPIDVDPLADPLGRPAEVADPFAIAPDPAFSHPIAHVPVNPRGTPDPFDTQPQRGRGFDDQDMFRGVAPPSDWSGLPQADHARATSAAMPAQRVVHPMSMDDFDKLLDGLDAPPTGSSARGGALPAQAAPIHIPTAPGALDISLDDLLGNPPAAQTGMPRAPVDVAPPAPQPGPGRAPDGLAGASPTSGPAGAPSILHAPDPFDASPVSIDPFQGPPVPRGGQATEAAAPAVDPALAINPTERSVASLADRGAVEARPLSLRPALPASHNPFEEPEPGEGTLRDALAAPASPQLDVAPGQPSPALAQAAAGGAGPAAAAAPNPEVLPRAAGDLSSAFSLFLEGAGLSPGQVDSSNPTAALLAAGAVFRAMAEGLREVLISRTEIKSEMRVERTMISSHGNNGLKFSVTPDEAVVALLTQKRPGYMPPLAATKEAFNDIKQHELAVMAGVQTALMDLLKRFEPDVLEKRLSPSALGAVLPAMRKARYWDGFQDAYRQISQEAEDDFQSIFGRSFAKAYTAQIRKE